MIRRLLMLLPIVAGLAACTTGSRLGNQNVAWRYSDAEGSLHPLYEIYSSDENTTRLFFRISSRELLYTRESSAGEFSAQLLLLYRLYTDNNQLADSGSIRLRDVQRAGERELAGQADMDAPAARRYRLEVSLRDLNRKQSVSEILHFDKSPGARSWFMVSAPGSALPLFDHILDSGQTFRIRTGNENYRYLNVLCWFGDAPVSPAPFSPHDPPPFAARPDSAFKIDLASDTLLRLPRRGMFFFTPDSTQKRGLTLLGFSRGYPEVREAAQLLPPLRYLTMRDEYADMQAQKNPQAAAEKFWLERAGSEERAKVIIRKFYSRVETANRHFTSYAEGWKTDRGMIFIVFGAPQYVYVSGDSETWIYGDGSTPMSLQFQFSRVSSPYSDNHFILNRSANYRGPWMHAVDQWREGRVYSER